MIKFYPFLILNNQRIPFNEGNKLQYWAGQAFFFKSYKLVCCRVSDVERERAETE